MLLHMSNIIRFVNTRSLSVMGCLVLVGQGLQPPGWIETVIDARDRDAAAPTFSPDGLYFMGPVYQNHWNLPQRTAAYDGLP